MKPNHQWRSTKNKKEKVDKIAKFLFLSFSFLSLTLNVSFLLEISNAKELVINNTQLHHFISPMARETRVQSKVESYQKLKKSYLMSLCLTLTIIRYRSRVKWSNIAKGVAPSATPCVVVNEKGESWIGVRESSLFGHTDELW